MGYIIHTDPTSVMPSQDFLKEDTVLFILDCINKGTENKLPPTPIVRINPSDGSFIAIDGHNLLAVNTMLGRECEVYVATTARDELTCEIDPMHSNEARIQRNRELAKKFDQVIDDAKNLSAAGIRSIYELTMKYPHLVALASSLRRNKE